VAEGQFILPVLLVITSVISAGYYLPVIMSMYMKPSMGRLPQNRLGPAAVGAIGVSVALVILLGVWPGGLLDLAGRSAATLTQTARPLAGP